MSYPVNPGAPVQTPSRLNKWWPISFFIAAVVMFVIGGALTGTYLANTSGCWNDYSYNYYSDYSSYYDYSCGSNYNGEFYGGIACFVIGGICKFIAWILLIVFCVKRRRSTTQYYHTAPPVQQPQQPYGAPQPYATQQFYPSPGAVSPYPQQPGQYPAQLPTHSPAPSPGPNYAQPAFQPPSASASPPPKEAVATTHYA